MSLNHVWLFATPWIVACQTPSSIGFSRQEHWSGLPFPSPGDLSYPRIKHISPALAGRFFTTEPLGKPHLGCSCCSCCCSVAKMCLTLCNTMVCSVPGVPVLHYFTEFAQTYVHRVSDTIQPSQPLSPPSPPALNLSHHQGLFQWVSSSHQVAKGLEFQLQHQSFQWIFRTDFL